MSNVIDNTITETNSSAELINNNTATDNTNVEKKKIYAQIPLTKVFFMMVVSLGIYAFFWLHRNWRIYCIRNKKKVHMIVNTIFFPVTSFSLFKDMTKNTTTALGLLAMQWLPLAMYYVMPQDGYLILFTQAAIFTFIQSMLNKPHDSAQEKKAHYKFNIPCIIVSVVSLSMFVMTLIKTL